MFSIRNAVYVAIMQVGVIVAGALAAVLLLKPWTEMNFHLSIPVALLINHTIIFLAVPVVWITFALLVRRRPQVSVLVKDLVFLSGILVLIALGIFVLYADVTLVFALRGA
jgi:hypothetical protein